MIVTTPTSISMSQGAESIPGLDAPVPMSFPTVLRAGGAGVPSFEAVDRGVDEAYLAKERAKRAKLKTRIEGKNWVRRRENGELLMDSFMHCGWC